MEHHTYRVILRYGCECLLIVDPFGLLESAHHYPGLVTVEVASGVKLLVEDCLRDKDLAAYSGDEEWLEDITLPEGLHLPVGVACHSGPSIRLNASRKVFASDSSNAGRGQNGGIDEDIEDLVG